MTVFQSIIRSHRRVSSIPAVLLFGMFVASWLAPASVKANAADAFMLNEDCGDAWGLSWMLDPYASLPSEIEIRIRGFVDVTAGGLDARVRNTLPAIDGLPRQLLALKYYLARTRREIRAKWAWTSVQEKRFRKSVEFRRVLEEVEKVRTAFSTANPGYSLRANLEVRTVRDQVASWNQTPSVTSAAGSLMTACARVMNDTLFAALPSRGTLERFRQFLLRFRPSVIPTVAVPGLSAHGQLRAFDFVVMQGNRVVAGTETASIRSQWDRAGWTAKLKEAVKTSGARFEGPLAFPREPWHYAYKP